MKKNFTIASALAITIAAFTTLSCQKDEIFTSDKQVEKSHNVEDTLISAHSDNLPGPQNSDKNTRDYLGDLAMPNAELVKIEFNKQNGEYNLYITLRQLIYPPKSIIEAQDKEYGFHVGIWDYALENQWWFIKTWHQRHTLDEKVDEQTSSVQAKILGADMFASKGIGERQLCVYLSIKVFGIIFYKKLHTIYYTEETKDIFDHLVD